jgi:hypothetical protein
MTQTQTKIEGKFYPLTPAVARKLRGAKLTAAEWRLWSYLIELDPFGEHYQDLPDTLTIMQEVEIKKTTFYTAIAKFQKLGLFDFQDKGFTFRNLRGIPKIRKTVQENGNLSEISENCSENRKAVQKVGSHSEKLENQSPEPAPIKASSSSQTIQTYSDFIQTLSDSERESFLEFGRKKASSLPHPPELPDKWIAANWEELHRQFLTCDVGRRAKQKAIADQFDWRSEPRFDDWIWKAFNGGYPWTQEDEAEREQRYAFWEWAQDTNAYEGVCY